jgi:hypothetical protein
MKTVPSWRSHAQKSDAKQINNIKTNQQMKNNSKSTKMENNNTNSSSNKSQTNNSNTMKKTTTENVKKTFTYESKIEKVAAIQIHPCYETLNQAVPNAIFAEFIKEFGYMERPLVTEDGYAITHPSDVLAAKDLGIEEIEIVMMKNATKEDVIRFMSFKEVVKHGKSRVLLYKTITLLTDHLTKTESGKEWAKEYDSNKTRTVVSKITGVSTGTIQNISTIGNKKPELLVEIDNGRMTQANAIKEVEPEIPFTSRKRCKDLSISNVEKDIKIPPQFTLEEIGLKIKDFGNLKLSITNTQANLELNGEVVESLTHKVFADNGDGGKRQQSQSHVFLPINDRFSIQVIIRDWNELDGYKSISVAA